jgi:hypothetical protein
VVAATSSQPIAAALQAGFLACLIFSSGALLLATTIEKPPRPHQPEAKSRTA